MHVKEFLQKSFMVLMILSVFGCAAIVDERVVFPVPPEKERFEWLGTYSAQADFDSRAIKALTGGGFSSGEQFFGVMGIAGGVDGRALVCDLAAQTVKVLDLDNKKISLFSSYVFGTPVSVAVDQQGQVYISDSSIEAVLVFSPDGLLLRTIGDKKVFNRPSFIAVNDELSRLYVSDPLDNDIKVFGLTGEFLFKFGQPGEEPGEFHGPQGLAFDSGGQLFVADNLNARIQVFTADGEFLRQFGERGTFHHQFEAPKGLAFDSEGHLYVTDSRKPSFSIFDPEDGSLLLWIGTETPQRGHKLGFTLPTGIYVDSLDRVYIGDLMLGRVTVWQYLSTAYLERAEQATKPQ